MGRFPDSKGMDDGINLFTELDQGLGTEGRDFYFIFICGVIAPLARAS